MTGADLRLTLVVVPGSYAICRLSADHAPPTWAARGSFCSMTRTPYELSIVCEADVVPDEVQAERGWSALAVQGPLDLNLTGILARLAVPLEAAGISIFAVSTYDTDYVLVRAGDFERAIEALRKAGHTVTNETADGASSR